MLFLIFSFSFTVHLVVPMGIFPTGKSGRFSPQGKPGATESRYPTLINDNKVNAWSFRVSVIHRTLTWATG